MKKIKLVVLVSIIALLSACTPQPEVNIPMPSKVKDFSGYASGNGYVAQFKITNNGNVMIYSDALVGKVMLVRDKNSPTFRGKFRDGVNIDTSTRGNVMAFGNIAYGNTNTMTNTSTRVRDISILYAFGYDKIKVMSPKHGFGSVVMTTTVNSKQDFSSWHKQLDKLKK